VLSPNHNYTAEVVFSSRLDGAVDAGIGTWQGGTPSGLAGWDYRTIANFSTVPEPRATVALTTGALALFACTRRLVRRRWA